MQGEDFEAQLPSETFSIDAVQALDEVLNWAVGLEHVFSPRFSAYASYATDNSGLTENVQRAGSVDSCRSTSATVTAGVGLRRWQPSGALHTGVRVRVGERRWIGRLTDALSSESDPDVRGDLRVPEHAVHFWVRGRWGASR